MLRWGFPYRNSGRLGILTYMKQHVCCLNFFFLLNSSCNFNKIFENEKFPEWSAANKWNSHLMFRGWWGFGLVGRALANGPGNLGSIPGRIIPNSLKMILDTSLLNTQQYKVRIKGKWEQSRERSSALPYTSV